MDTMCTATKFIQGRPLTRNVVCVSRNWFKELKMNKMTSQDERTKAYIEFLVARKTITSGLWFNHTQSLKQ